MSNSAAFDPHIAYFIESKRLILNKPLAAAFENTVTRPISDRFFLEQG